MTAEAWVTSCSARWSTRLRRRPRLRAPAAHSAVSAPTSRERTSRCGSLGTTSPSWSRSARRWCGVFAAFRGSRTSTSRPTRASRCCRSCSTASAPARSGSTWRPSVRRCARRSTAPSPRSTPKGTSSTTCACVSRATGSRGRRSWATSCCSRRPDPPVRSCCATSPRPSSGGADVDQAQNQNRVLSLSGDVLTDVAPIDRGQRLDARATRRHAVPRRLRHRVRRRRGGDRRDPTGRCCWWWCWRSSWCSSCWRCSTRALLDPLVILMAVPLALVGVMIALWVTGTTLSAPVYLGMIMLAGIVVNNSILLVEFVEHYRHEQKRAARGSGGGSRRRAHAADPDDDRHLGRGHRCRWR